MGVRGHVHSLVYLRLSSTLARPLSICSQIKALGQQKMCVLTTLLALKVALLV